MGAIRGSIGIGSGYGLRIRNADTVYGYGFAQTVSITLESGADDRPEKVIGEVAHASTRAYNYPNSQQTNQRNGVIAMNTFQDLDTNAAQQTAQKAPALSKSLTLLATLPQFINSQEFGHMDWQLRRAFINALTLAAGLAPQYLLRV